MINAAVITYALIILELFLYSFIFDFSTLNNPENTIAIAAISHIRSLAQILVAAFAAFILATTSELQANLQNLKLSRHADSFKISILCNLLVFLGLLALSSLLFNNQQHANTIAIAWLITAAALIASWLRIIANWRFWRQLVASHRLAGLFSLLAGLVTWAIGLQTQELWGTLANLTFYTSGFFLTFFYPKIILDLEFRSLGTLDFYVNVAPVCSGYEGIGLIITFTAFFLITHRKDFRFPASLLLFPIGIFTIWILNALRITLLIVIGDKYSADVAVNGFHSQAGWIFFIIVSVGLLLLAHKVSFFSKAAQRNGDDIQHRNRSADPYLIPFIILLATTFITQIFASDLDYLYPIKIICVSFSLYYLWKPLRIKLKVMPETLFAGTLAFLLWIALTPQSPLSLGNALSQLPMVASIGWILFRIFGSVVAIPIAEELIFRGYLFSRLSQTPLKPFQKIDFQWPTLLISSVLFGLIHQSWIAGGITGLIYGIVRFRSGDIIQPIVAHGFTNLLICLYVLGFGQWYLW